MSDPYNPTGREFYDAKSGRRMKYVPLSSDHWTRGWLLYATSDGGWATLRKPTLEEIQHIEVTGVLNSPRAGYQ